MAIGERDRGGRDALGFEAHHHLHFAHQVPHLPFARANSRAFTSSATLRGSKKPSAGPPMRQVVCLRSGSETFPDGKAFLNSFAHAGTSEFTWVTDGLPSGRRARPDSNKSESVL